MLVEEIIFLIISIIFIVIYSAKLLQKKDNIYAEIIGLILIGDAIDVLTIMLKPNFNIAIYIIKYICSIIIPLVFLILESKHKHLTSIIRYNIAQTLYKLNKTKLAKDLLTKIVLKDSKFRNAHKLLAQIYYNEGGIRKAIDEYVYVLELNPKDYDAYYSIALFLNELNKEEEAIEMLKKLIINKPDYVDGSILLSDIMIKNEKYKEAQTILLDAYKFNQYSYDICLNLGIVSTLLNEFPQAKQYYEKAATLNALSYITNFNRAQIELMYKNIEEAQKIFYALLEDEEINAEAYLELSKIFLLKKDNTMAINYANLAIELNPKLIVPKIKNDQIFIPIMGRISIPFNLDYEDSEIENGKQQSKRTSKKDKKVRKPSEKEIKAKEHLEQMQGITRSLSYNDIDILDKKTKNNHIIESLYKAKEDKAFLENVKEIEKGLEEKENYNSFFSINTQDKIDEIETKQENLDNEKLINNYNFKIKSDILDMQNTSNINNSYINSIFNNSLSKELKERTGNIKDNLDLIGNIKTQAKQTDNKHLDIEQLDTDKTDNKKDNIADNNVYKEISIQFHKDLEQYSKNNNNSYFKSANDEEDFSKKYDITSYLDEYKAKYATKIEKDQVQKPEERQEQSLNRSYLNNCEIVDITKDFNLVVGDEKKEEIIDNCFTRQENILIEKYLNKLGLKNTTKEEYKKYLFLERNKKHIKDIAEIEKNRY